MSRRPAARPIEHCRPERRVSEDAIYGAIAAELSGYYTTIITASSLFLGGVLTLLTTLDPPGPLPLGLLAIGCVCLVGAMGCIAGARWKTVIAGRRSYECRQTDSERAESWSVGLARSALWCFVCGLLFIAVGVFAAVIEEQSMADKPKYQDKGGRGNESRPSQTGNESKRSAVGGGGTRAALPINIVRDSPNTGTGKDDGKKK